MRDIHSEDAAIWGLLEKKIKELAHSYGYSYIKFPILEKTALFKRSIGLATDIVEKEMYTFIDRNDDSLSLRPEGTAVCVRAGISQGLLHNQRQKLWYMGPMFRRERPQKDRYRQFEQFGLEVFGIDTADIEVELIMFCERLWNVLGISDNVQLNINSLGSLESRNVYKLKLVEYFKKHIDELDDDSVRRLETNPLRILDSKNTAMSDVINQAPRLLDHLDQKSKEHFTNLQSMLDQLNIKYVIKPTLVRGLDYYNDTVFEWSTNVLGASSEIGAGGRYDSLVDLLGGRDGKAVGFAIGLDRIVSLMKLSEVNYKEKSDVYILSELESLDVRVRALEVSELIRNKYPDLLVSTFCGNGSMKKQFKEAGKNNSSIVVILTKKELDNNTVSVKFLNADQAQTMYTMQEFDNFLLSNFGNH